MWVWRERERERERGGGGEDVFECLWDTRREEEREKVEN